MNRPQLSPDEFKVAVEKARQMTPEERMDEGFRLTEEWFANATREQIREVESQRRIEELLYYSPRLPRLDESSR